MIRLLRQACSRAVGRELSQRVRWRPHGPSHQLEHVAAGTKQPLTEKLQNGPAQKHRQKQKLLGAERAVKQPTDSDVGALETVIAMGFDRTQSRIALKTCGGNANRAIEFLLNR